MTWQGDLALTSRKGAVTGFIAPSSVHRQFGRRGLRHNREGDAWLECDGKTVHLLEANHRQVQRGKDSPTVDLGHGQSDGWRNR